MFVLKCGAMDGIFLENAIKGEYSFYILLWIVFIKILATSLTVGSGGSGGVFGPALFIGGMFGEVLLALA